MPKIRATSLFTVPGWTDTPYYCITIFTLDKNIDQRVFFYVMFQKHNPDYAQKPWNAVERSLTKYLLLNGGQFEIEKSIKLNVLENGSFNRCDRTCRRKNELNKNKKKTPKQRKNESFEEIGCFETFAWENLWKLPVLEEQFMVLYDI